MNHQEPEQHTDGVISNTPRERFLGCLLGGAVGDALGAQVEFMSRATILRQFRPDGITDYASVSGIKLVSNAVSKQSHGAGSLNRCVQYRSLGRDRTFRAETGVKQCHNL